MSKVQDKKEGAKATADVKKIEDATSNVDPKELDAALAASGGDDAGTPPESLNKDKGGKSEASDGQTKLGKWSEDQDAEIRRVFRVAQYKKGVPYRDNIATLLKEAVVIGNQKIGAKAITLSPNHALQYVLIKGAIDYADQLEALRVMEAKGVIKEINPEYEGVVWLPEKILLARKAEAEYKKRMAELEAM